MTTSLLFGLLLESSAPTIIAATSEDVGTLYVRTGAFIGWTSLITNR